MLFADDTREQEAQGVILYLKFTRSDARSDVFLSEVFKLRITGLMLIVLLQV